MTFKDKLKYGIGFLSEKLMPRIAADIDANINTDKMAKLKKCVVFTRSHRAKSKGDLGRLENALTSYWQSNTGDTFHSKHIEERYALFLELHAYIIDELAQAVGEAKSPFSRLIEIGCGDGQALEYCSTKLPELSLIGLDINASAIERAKRDHSGAEKKIEYVTTDALSWLDEHPQSGTILMTNGGVLEYFNQSSVAQLFRLISSSAPAAVVLVEPLAPDHDLSCEQESIVFGRENTFSHDYPDILRTAGFTVQSQRDFTHTSARWIVILATKECQ